MDDAGEIAPVGLEPVQRYYGQVLGGTADLQTDACSTAEAPSPRLKRALANVHDEVLARYYGCGLIAPLALRGARVLDLGCGSGRDAYVLAQLVGEAGSVTGVDATPEQLAVAERHRDWHRARFGYARDNVTFLEGDIARLNALPLAEASFDVIVSNCVINLVEDKAAVFAAAHRLLKSGGEMYFSDVYADRRPPPGLMADPVLRGECLAGALYWNDFLSLAKAASFGDPRLVSDRPLLPRLREHLAYAEGHAVPGPLRLSWRLQPPFRHLRRLRDEPALQLRGHGRAGERRMLLRLSGRSLTGRAGDARGRSLRGR